MRDEFNKNDALSITNLLNIIDPLHDAHCLLLKEVELRLATWENRGAHHHKIADIFLKAVSNLQVNIYRSNSDIHKARSVPQAIQPNGPMCLIFFESRVREICHFSTRIFFMNWFSVMVACVVSFRKPAIARQAVPSSTLVLGYQSYLVELLITVLKWKCWIYQLYWEEDAFSCHKTRKLR